MSDSKPDSAGNERENEWETGRWPLAVPSQDDRGPAYTAAVERTEAAFRHAREAIGDGVVIDTAGELARLAAALPPEMSVLVDDVVRVAGDSQGDDLRSAVVARIATLAERPETPVRDHRGAEHHVLVPGLELGTVLLPGGDPATAGGETRPWRAWDKMLDSVDRDGPGDSLAAVAAVLDRIAALLTDPDDGAGRYLLRNSPIDDAIAAEASRIRDAATALSGLATAAAAEEDADVAGAGGPVPLDALARQHDCAVITDPELIERSLWSSDRPGWPAPVLGEAEAWDYPAVQADCNALISAMLATEGITWVPGAAEATLPDGMGLPWAAYIWRECCGRLGGLLDTIATETLKGRPAGDVVRSPGVPGARWVTAASLVSEDEA